MHILLNPKTDQSARVISDPEQIPFQFRTTRYLFVGTILGVLGAGSSIYITFRFVDSPSRQLNMYGDRFESGLPYYPESVSNMVNDPSSAAGKVWYGLMSISALLVMMSWYPYELRNAYVGRELRLFPFLARSELNPRMATARSLLPPLGLLFVTLVHSEPANMFDPAMEATLVFHTGGALLWIGVTIWCEVYTLKAKIKFAKYEVVVRWTSILLAIFSGAVYMVFSSLSAKKLGLCCDDVYSPVNETVISRAFEHKAFMEYQMDKQLFEQARFSTAKMHPPVYHGLYNTAYSYGFYIKMLSFWGEIFAGFFVLMNQAAIWYFCEERKFEPGPNEIPADL